MAFEPLAEGESFASLDAKTDSSAPDGDITLAVGEFVPTVGEIGPQGTFRATKSRVQDNRYEATNEAPPTFEEFNLRKDREEARTLWEDTKMFFTGMGHGIAQLYRTGIDASEEAYNAVREGEVKKLAKTGAEGMRRSIFDMADMGEAISGRIGDLRFDDGKARERQYSRFLEDMEDQKTRSAGLWFDEQETFKNLTEVGSVVLDPTNFIGLGWATKAAKVSKLGTAMQKAGHILDTPNRITRAGLRKAVKGGAKGAGFLSEKAVAPTLRVLGKSAEWTQDKLGAPSRGITNFIAKTGDIGKGEAAAIRLSATGATLLTPITTPVAAVLGGLEAGSLTAGAAKAGFKASANIADDMGVMLNALSDPAQQMRFIEKAIHPSSGLSPAMRAKLSIAGSGGTKALDLAFNSLANGLSSAELQALTAFAATSDPYAIGQAAGTGAAFGSVVPTGPGGGVTKQQRTDGSIAKYLNKKFEADQFKHFDALPKNSQKLLASLSEAGTEAKVILQDKDTFLQTRAHETGFDSTESTAGFIAEDGTIFINANANSKDIDTVVTHEIGHRIAREIVIENRAGSVLGLRNEILTDFKSDTGVTLPTSSGVDVTVGGEIAKFYDAYNSQLSDEFKIKDAETLVDEYMADVVGVLLDETDFNAIEAMRKKPGTLEALSRVSHSLLGKVGLIDPETGIKTKSFQPISKAVSKNPILRRALNNHYSLNKAIEKIGTEKAKGVTTKRGQSDESAIRAADVDPGEVFIPSDVDTAIPGFKKVVGDFWDTTIFEPKHATPGRIAEDIGHVIHPGYLDKVGANPTMRRVTRGFEDAIQEFSTVKFWKKKGKGKVEPHEGVPFGIVINQANGNISVKYWDQNKMNPFLHELKSKGLISSVKQLKHEIKVARERQAAGENIGNETVAAIFGARENAVSSAKAKAITRIATKKIFRQVSVKDIRSFKNYNDKGMGVRIYNALTNQRPDVNPSTGLTQKTFSELTFDEKVTRLGEDPYTDGKSYHVTSPENLDRILKEGLTGDEIWITQDKPWKEYQSGVALEMDLSGFDLRKDSRWQDKHGVMVTREAIPPERITKVFEWIDELDTREDVLAERGSKVGEDKIKKLLLRKGVK